MADTKKPNFAEALKAQAKPAASSSADESVIVDLGDGQPTTLYRGKGSTRMDDAQWARLKQRAVKALPAKAGSGGDAESEAFAARAGTQAQAEANKLSAARSSSANAADSRRQALLDLVNNPHFQPGKDSIVPDKDTLDIVRKMKPSDQADYLEKRIQHQEWQQQQEVDRSKKMSEKDQPPATDTGVTKPDQGTPDEWKPPFTPPGSRGLQTEDDVKLGMGANPRNPASMVPQLAMGAMPSNAKPRRSDRVMPEVNIDPNAPENNQVMPELDIGAVATQQGLERSIREGNAQAAMAEGLDFTTPESRLAASIKDASKSPPQYQQVTDNNDTQVSQQVTDNNDTAINPKRIATQRFGQAGVPADEGYVEPGTPTAFDQLARTIGQTPEMLGGLFRSPDGSGAPLRSGRPGGPDPLLPQPGISQDGKSGASGSMSVSGRMPGGAPSIKPLDIKEQQRMMAEGYATQNMANALVADQQSQLLSQKAGLIRQQQDESAQLAARQAAMESARTERMKKGAAGLASLQTRLADIEQQAPDPNRFWNNKTDGQKAAAVIAGALFGFSGQGMQWLQRLDGLVERDIQQQAAELQRKGGVLGKQIDVQNNLVAMARQEGLDESESISAARAMMLNKYALQFEAAAATTGSEQVKAQALANSGILRQKMAQEQADMALKTNKAAQEAALTAAQVSHLNAQTYAARVAAAGGGKGSGDNKLAPGTREEIAKIDKGLEAIKQAREALQGGNKFTDQLANDLRRNLSFVGLDNLGMYLTPDTTGRTAVAESAQETALKGVMGEALQEKDIERNRPRFARPGLNSDNTKWLDSQEEVLIAKRNALVKNNSEADLGTTPSNRLTSERPAQ